MRLSDAFRRLCGPRPHMASKFHRRSASFGSALLCFARRIRRRRRGASPVAGQCRNTHCSEHSTGMDSIA
eukprot:1462670-Alexandrium_andersonii.AAC.1